MMQTWEDPSTLMILAHRSSASRSFLLVACGDCGGLHLDTSHAVGRTGRCEEGTGLQVR